MLRDGLRGYSVERRAESCDALRTYGLRVDVIMKRWNVDH